MDPKLWGRGGWILIFVILHRYMNDLDKCKQSLNLICNMLPCEKCKSHTLHAMTINNILSSNDWLYIKHFFIALYNSHHENKIII